MPGPKKSIGLRERDILRYLKTRSTPATIKEISDQTDIDPTYVRAVANRFVKNGIILRAWDQSKYPPSMLISITQKGQNILIGLPTTKQGLKND